MTSFSTSGASHRPSSVGTLLTTSLLHPGTTHQEEPVTDRRLEGPFDGSVPNQANGHLGATKVESQAAALHRDWATDPRWSGIERSYSADDVVKLRGSVQEEHTLARLGAERLWQLLRREEPVRALGALTGGQAVQMVRAGLDAIYLSGWQGAADANLAGAPCPD